MYGFCVLNLPNMFPKFTKIWKEVRAIKCNTTLCSISIFIYIYIYIDIYIYIYIFCVLVIWRFTEPLRILRASFMPSWVTSLPGPLVSSVLADSLFRPMGPTLDSLTPVRSLPCMKQPNFQQQYVLRNDFEFLPIFCYFFASCGIQILLENEGHHMNEQTAKPNQSVLQFVCVHFNRPQPVR